MTVLLSIAVSFAKDFAINTAQFLVHSLERAT